MNIHLKELQPYPFARLRNLFEGLIPNAGLRAINLGIGEPQHTAPVHVVASLSANLQAISNYPTVLGIPELRSAICRWACSRFKLSSLDPDTQVLPVNGTREALFSIAQVICSSTTTSSVFAPNPFYQIYEGAAVMAGAKLVLLACEPHCNYQPDYRAIEDSDWAKCNLLYLCNPGNPAGGLIDRDTLTYLISKALEHDFVIVSDECYSEIYRDETNPPPGLLEVCAAIGNTQYTKCLAFHSLSKRSNLPGMRSGFVAGDASILEPYLQYRTYHGCTMPLYHQQASITAWEDEQHVIENRSLYRAKFERVLDTLRPHYPLTYPDGGFYIWLPTPIDDELFAQRLYQEYSVTALPGTYLGRVVNGRNPGKGYLRMALVASVDDCLEAAQRVVALTEKIRAEDV
jgi:N-succinyldiaminopimelate aminotransferase